MQTAPISGPNIPAGSTSAPLQQRAQAQVVTAPIPPTGPTLPLRVARAAATMADLEKAIGYDDGCTVTVSGFYKPRDGGGGTFQYVKDCTLAPVPGIVVVPLGGEGRYLRNLDGSPINVLWTGARPGGSYDCTAAIQAAIDFAQRPTYGAVTAESPFCGILSVYAPPGRYRTTATLKIAGAEFYGRYGGSANFNCHTVFLSDHGGHFIQYTFSEESGYQVGTIRDMFVVGSHEKYQKNKVAILGATDRTKFTVAPSAVSDVFLSAPESHQLNMCFFHDAEGSFIGHGVVKKIDKATGLVTLEDGADNYSGGQGGLLSKTDTVVFSPLVTEVGFSFIDPASAGAVGIFCSNASKSIGRTPVIRNVLLNRFHCGIRLAPSTLGATFENVTVSSFKFAGVASPLSYATTDNRMDGMYISGLYGADYGFKHNLTPTYPVFRQGAFGIYGVGAADKVTGVIEECSFANLYVPWTIQQTLADVTLDGVKRHAVLLGRGYSQAAGPHTSWLTFGILLVRTSLVNTPVDPYHQMSVFHSRGIDTTRPPKIGISQLLIANGGGSKFRAEVSLAPGAVQPTLAVSMRTEANGLQ